MANRRFNQFLYTPHAMPVLIDCNFGVLATNSLGISNLKGTAVQNVFMHTSTTPGTGNNSLVNPNPEESGIVVQLQDNYNKLFGFSWSINAPISGTGIKIDNSALTAGVLYTISILGTSTEAVWHAIGVPAGITPAVGVSFVALTVGAGANSSTSRVQISAATGSGVAAIELVGVANNTIAPLPGANQGYGSQLLFQCRDYAGALVAPVDGSLIYLQMYLSNSSVIVSGE